MPHKSGKSNYKSTPGHKKPEEMTKGMSENKKEMDKMMSKDMKKMKKKMMK